MKESKTIGPSFNRRLALLRRSFLWGMPLVVWMAILHLALISSRPEIAKENKNYSGESLQILKEDCTFAIWKNRDLGLNLQPDLQLKAKSAVTHFKEKGACDEELQQARGISQSQKLKAQQVVANCQRALYNFSSRRLVCDDSRIWLIPKNRHLRIDAFSSDELDRENIGFGKCRHVVAHFDRPFPRFEALGLVARVPTLKQRVKR